jgi:hypothetical protein
MTSVEDLRAVTRMTPSVRGSTVEPENLRAMTRMTPSVGSGAGPG